MTNIAEPPSVSLSAETETPPQNLSVMDASGQLALPLDEKEMSTLTRCEAVIEEHLQKFYQVGSALLTIREKRLYRATHATFEAYCTERWRMARAMAYRWMDAVDVVNNLSPIGDILPANEAQARPLAALPPAQQQEAWEKTIELAKGAVITAALVQEAVNLIAPKPEPASEPAPRDAQAVLTELSDMNYRGGAEPAAEGGHPESASPLPGAPSDLSTKMEEVAAGADALTEKSEQAVAWGEANRGQPEPYQNAIAEYEASIAKTEESKPEPPKTGQPKPEPAKAEPLKAAAPEKVALPDGWTTALIKEADYERAMDMGLWPLAAAIEEVEAQRLAPELSLHPVALQAGAMLEAWNREKEVITEPETALLHEMYPDRAATTVAMIASILIVKRCRDLRAKGYETPETLLGIDAPGEAAAASDAQAEDDADESDNPVAEGEAE
jgi:hypothetical protein